MRTSNSTKKHVYVSAHPKFPKIFFFLLLFFIAFLLFSFDDSPSCMRYLEKNFFNRSYVLQAMSMANYPQSQWEPTISALNDALEDAHDIIRKKTAKYPRDPLEYPIILPEVRKIFLDTMFDIFNRIMIDQTSLNQYMLTPGAIQEMFGYVKRKQKILLDQCFGPELEPPPSKKMAEPPPNPAPEANPYPEFPGIPSIVQPPPPPQYSPSFNI